MYHAETTLMLHQQDAARLLAELGARRRVARRDNRIARGVAALRARAAVGRARPSAGGVEPICCPA